MNLPELLAPAGSFDAAVAAFTYGADAVYLGMSRFSARADAANFSDDELRQIIAYARNLPRPRKVYVTLNTLLETRELADLYPALALLEELGADGVIVQDLGVASLIRRDFPAIPLHASTQLACTSLAGALALKALGFTRIVTARELTLQEAAEIGRKAEIEIEVFIHGALCYSISGLCLFSSLTTGRSGNRGRCAYCCRQPFCEGSGSGPSCHPFSMRDLSLAQHGDLLRTLPLASLKIEGRMKNPLYVASVTDFYRSILDAPLSDAEIKRKAEDLQTIFSRPWTPLYAVTEQTEPGQIIDPACVGHRGAPIGTIRRTLRDPQGVTWLAFTTSRAIERHDGLQIDPPQGGRPVGFAVSGLRDAKTKRPAISLPAGTAVEVALPPDFSGTLPRGATVYCSASQAVRRAFPVQKPRTTELRTLRPADLTLTLTETAMILEGNGAAVSTPADLAPAKDPARSKAAAEKQLTRLGEDGFFLRSLTVNNPKGLFLPASLLNQTRRAWAEAARTEAAPERDAAPPHYPAADLPAKEKAHYTVKVSVLQSPDSVTSAPMPERVILALTVESTCDTIQPWLEAVPAEKLRIALPAAMRTAHLQPMRTVIRQLIRQGFRDFECSDLASWQLLQDANPEGLPLTLSADWSWYAVNAEAAALQQRLGIRCAVTGPEANLENLKRLPETPEHEVLIAQYTPLFIAFTRPLAQEKTLVSRQNDTLRFTRIGHLWSTFCDRPWSIAALIPDLLKAGYDTFRIDLSWAGADLPVTGWKQLLTHPDPLPHRFTAPRL